MSRVKSNEDEERSNTVLENPSSQRFTSQIPVPSQGIRKNNVNNGLTDMINKSIARNSLAGPKKKMRATDVNGVPPGGFRLSQRYSSLPSTNNTSHSFISARGETPGIQNVSSNRDPRPLRDRNFQNAIQQEIFDYLSSNKFDLETNHPISLKFLKQPTQKGFVVIFKWLYLRLDPGYTFTKSFEHEVYQTLKTLRYPYLETINKSQISAVGGSSWPKFLGVLHWLVQTNLKLDRQLNKLDQNIINQNTQELTILNHSLNTLDDQDQKQEKYELMVEKLFIDYVIDSYKSFLRLEDDYTPFMEELKRGFDRFTHIIKMDINNLGTQNETIYSDCQEMAKRNKKIGIATTKCKALKSDLTKFQNFINTMDYKSHEWPKKLEKMRLESTNKVEHIRNLEENVRELESLLRERGISITLIDEKTKHRESITAELEAVSGELDHLVSTMKSEKHQTEAAATNMKATVKQYNSAITNLINSCNRQGDNIDQHIFKIELSGTLLQDFNDAIRYEKLFPPNFTIKDTIKKELLNLYNHMEKKVKELEKENYVLENHLVDLKDQIDEKTNLISRLELELSEVNSNYELSRQEYESDLLSQHIEIEQLKKKIQDSRDAVERKLLDAKKLVENKKLHYEESLLDFNRKKMSLHSKIIGIIENTSNFKINVQTMLEKAENDITHLTDSTS